MRQLLTQGQVLPEFRESGDPTERAQEGRGRGLLLGLVVGGGLVFEGKTMELNMV